jgi:hypothetical protein
MIGDYMTKTSSRHSVLEGLRPNHVSDIQGQERPSQAKNGKSDTHKIKPTKGKKTKPRKGKTATKILVPSKEKGWHHRSVLGEVERTNMVIQKPAYVWVML